MVRIRQGRKVKDISEGETAVVELKAMVFGVAFLESDVSVIMQER